MQTSEIPAAVSADKQRRPRKKGKLTGQKPPRWQVRKGSETDPTRRSDQVCFLADSGRARTVHRSGIRRWCVAPLPRIGREARE
jgi:hypothetical protein